MSDLTSEKIAKALKGAGLSAKQRIEKATEAWNNEAIFFPNKDDFLFDWICSAFAKPNMKKLDDCCLSQLPYWTLLASLLKHYQEKARLDPKRSVPTIHVNLVSTVSTLLQQLYKRDVKEAEDRVEFLALTHQCLEILFSDSFTLSYRPAFEHVYSAVDQVLISLSTQINLCQESDTDPREELNALHQLCLTAQVLLKKFDSQLVMAANQKKIFSSIVEKSLIKLTSVRRRISLLENNQDSAIISETITDIICHALFHADTVLEFTSVLKDVDNDNTAGGDVKQTNYVVRLFDTLESMVNDTKDQEQMLDALDITPILFSAFLDAFRQKRNTSSSAMQDVSRMAEFGIFVYLSKIIGNIKKKAVSAYLETLCKLLKELLQWNVFSARNDDIAKSQQDVLNSIAENVVSYLGDTKRYNQGLVLDLADTLLQIDFSLIENRVHSLWPILLNSENDAQESCLKFAKSILNTYTASRQLDVFVEDLIKYIGQIDSDDVYTLLRKPMFTRDFLNEFSSLIRKSMPAAQALGIFKNFQENLILATKASSDEPVTKKQKKSAHSNGKINKNNSTAALITVYFVEFTNALKLNQQQVRTFEEPVMSVFDNFVKPVINKSVEAKSDNDDDVLPAMQIHSALISVFYEVYFLKINAKDQEWLAESYLHIFNKSIKSNTLGSRIAVASSTNIILQHVYYTLLSGVSSVSQTVDLVNAVVDFITEKEKESSWYEATEWNGSILDLDNRNTVKLACWKLLSDEWFESVVRHIDNTRAEKIASIIYLSLTNDLPSTTSVSAQLLNKSLLRSANFYEAKCFKDCNIQTLVHAVIELFSTKLSKSSANDVSKVTAKKISSMDISKTISLDQKSIKDLSNVLISKQDNMDEDIDASSSNNVEKIATFLKLLLLFPNEYYEKNERSQILYLTTLIDIWSVSCTSAHPLIRTKVSLMCRGLQLRFIGYFSANSILGMDSVVLDWLVSSNQIWSAGDDTELENALVSLDHVTNELDLNICRRVIMNASAKTPDAHSVTYLEQTLKQRTESLDNNASKASLGKLINLIKAINLVLSNRKFAEVDLSNAVYATDSMSKISHYVITSLEEAKASISSILEQVKQESCTEKASIIAQHKSEFESIKYVFHLTRLLQEYACIVGPQVDEVISAKTLSSTLTAVASTFIQFLQSALLSGKSENNAVLNMTTEFIAAFCSILSRYQQVETTKRVLAAIWFVYSLVLNIGDQESVEILSTAFASWIQSLSKEQYTILIESFIEQSEEEANNRGDITKEQHHVVFLSLFSLLLKHCNDSEKGRLRKQIPTFVLKLSLIAGKTTCLKYLQEMLKLLIQLTGDQSYHFSDYDASLVLSCLLQVAHPTAPERFKGHINREIAHRIFDDVCAILSNFVSHHKEQIVYMMPPFIAFIQSLLHCFKSTHVSLVIGTNAPTRKRKLNAEQKDSKTFTGRTIPLLYEFTPLDDSSAQRLGRVLTTIPQKQHSTTTSAVTAKNQKSTQALHKIIAKHTPSILIEYFTIQSNPTMSVVHPSTKSILTQALYDILDMCSDADRTFILSCLDGPGKSLFKAFYTSWKENHKYTGQ